MTITCLLLAVSGAITPPSPTIPWWTTPVIKQVAPGAKAAKEIVIDIKTQQLRALEDGEEVFVFRCCTGKNNKTPRGEFPIRQKLRHNRALPKYGGGPIPWSLRLDVVRNGRRMLIAIHAYKSVPKVPSSNGCIRLTYEDAPKLFEWAEVGTTVTIK